VILRLAIRSLAVRPWRTAVLAAGFGLGIGVMVALLGVGEVIIEQAHAPALQGGGDLVVSGAFGPIESARYVLANVLGSREIRSRLVATSPTRRATLYLSRPDGPIAVSARGGLPSLARAVGDPEVAHLPAWTDEPRDASWSHPQPTDILRAMDRFHPVPRLDESGGSAGFSAASWAEWLYFNGRSADGSLRFYLTFLVGPPATDGQCATVVRLQLDRNGRSTNYSAAGMVDAATLLAHAPDLDIEGNQVRLLNSHYRLRLALAQESASQSSPELAAPGPKLPAPSREPPAPSHQPHLEGDFVLDASAGRSLPPAAIHGARGWVSGYVVPVLSGAVRGSLRIGGETVSLDGAVGYHDHNWGFWEGVRWQWGQVAHDDVSIVFGRVFPPAAVADPDRVPGFLALLGPSGPLGFSADVTIAERANTAGTPSGMTIQARGPRIDVRLTLSVEESVTTLMSLTRVPGGAAMNFVQLGGTFRVDGRAADRALAFTARGAAETFRATR
jgi:hypothetical protein